MLLVRPLPVERESFRGYLCRTADANGLAGIRELFYLVNMSSADSHDAALLRWLGHEPDVLRRLAGLVPKADGYQGTVRFGQRLRDRYWNVKIPRCCPHCLQQRSVWQSYWELTLAVACPRHRVRLLDHCSGCKRPLSWHRPELLKCACGQPLAELPTEGCSREELALSAIQYSLLHHVQLPEDGARFTGWSLQQFIGLIWFLGAYAVNRHSVHPLKVDGISQLGIAMPLVQAAGRLLDDWPMNFHGLLHQLKSSQDDAQSLKGVFGHFYHALYREFSDARFSFLHHAFEDYVKQHWPGTLNRRHRRFTAATLEDHAMLPLPKAATMLRLSRDSVKQLVATGTLAGKSRLLPSGRKVLAVERASVEQYLRGREDQIGFEAARTHLNLRKKRFRALLNAGVLQPTSGPTVDGKPVWKFCRQHIQELVDHPARLLLPDQRLTAEKEGDLISVSEVAAQLGIKQEVAYFLIRKNLLASVPFAGKRVGSRAVTPEALVAFRKSYISAAELSAIVNIAPRYLIPRMSQHGVVPVCGPTMDGCRQYFFKRNSEVVGAVGYFAFIATQ